MNKGMFYLLPFLVLIPVAASSALIQVEVTSLTSAIEHVKTTEVSKATLTVAKPISGRNTKGRNVIKLMKPRAGRNATRLRDRKLIKR